ncbi:MAG: hypothetical protein WKF77_31760, partial [Planctomycetaceae bacterium]
MLKFLVSCLLHAGLVGLVLVKTMIAQPPDAASALAGTFAKADQNSDKNLSRTEYESLRGSNPEQLRDFIVFDLNLDQTLSEAEFTSIPSVAGHNRGPMADPFSAIVEQLLESIAKQAAKKDDVGDNVEFATERFLIAFQKVVSDRRPPAAMADPDQDGIVTRDEAQRFFEI